MSKSGRWGVAALLGVFAVTTVFLGRWQLRRLASRKASNARIAAARALPPLVLGEGALPRGDRADRRLMVRGAFLPDSQIFIRNRVQDDAPGIEVVTPFAIAGSDSVIWVLRGFIRAPDGVAPTRDIPAPAADTVTVSGFAERAMTHADGGSPLTREGRTTWKVLDGRAMAEMEPASLAVVLHLTGDSTGPGRLDPVPPVPLGNGPHLSYAIQWFGMATAAVAFAIFIVLRSADPERARRRAAP